MEQVFAANPKPSVNALDTMAASYAAANRFADAVRLGEQAVELAEQKGPNDFTKALRERVTLYRESRSYRDDS